MRAYRYVFVVTYGRSGSTLLMGLLNTIPGYRIRGENHNALYHLYQADAAVRQGWDRHGAEPGDSPQNPWYGTPSWRPDAFRAALVDAFVSTVLCPEPGDRVIGFKEIRYTPAHIKDLTEYLQFLRTAFPGSKIVFNHRRVEDVAKSGWWSDAPNALERITAADERLMAFPADDRHFHFHFDRIDDGLDNVRALFRFLGEDFDEERIRQTLKKPHSYAVGGEPSGPVRRARAAARRVLSLAARRR